MFFGDRSPRGIGNLSQGYWVTANMRPHIVQGETLDITQIGDTNCFIN